MAEEPRVSYDEPADITIIENGGKFRVDPPVARVNSSQTQVTFSNLTNHEVNVWLPFAPAAPITLPSGARRQYSLEGATRGFHDYGVFVHGGIYIQAAEGNSAPHMVYD